MMPPEKVVTLRTSMAPPFAIIVPLLAIPPKKIESPRAPIPALTALITPPVELTMPPEQLETSKTKIAAWLGAPALIVPLLAMPPKKLVSKEATTPVSAAAIVPVLVIPPPAASVLPNRATLWTLIPRPPAEILPLLLMAPAKVETLRMRSMPVDFATIVPVLAIPPPAEAVLPN
jgi:hypothetical protein